MDMAGREQAVRRWFSMWLEGRDTGILQLFAPDALYIESWGPEYRGAQQIQHWFEEWNTRGKVLVWDIRGFFHREDRTVVEWYFENKMHDGTAEIFDGLSLVDWDRDGRICRLQEFGCNLHRYDPYADGLAPKFREGAALWF